MSKPNADDHLDVDTHIEKRFEIIKLVGKGAYGIVWRAIDRKTKQVVALKKVFDGFSNQTDAQRTYREVMFLQRIHHDNIVKLLSVHKAENHTDLYLVFEYIDTDLYATIRSNLLQEIHKRFVTYQLLRCVRFLHKHGLIHRDLKPANILLNSDCHAKLADFGLARSLVQLERDGNPKQILTDYVATRWYRPPEIVTGSVHYSRGVDMWAIGCIIGEMLTGKPLLPGTSTSNQMERVIAICGAPSQEDIRSLRSSYAEEMIRNLRPVAPRPLKQMLAGHDKQAVDLMSKMLVFGPEKRISCAAAMCHPYVSQFCTPEELVADDGPVTDPILLPVPDCDRLEISDYRDALYREMTKQKRESRDKKLQKQGTTSTTGKSGVVASQQHTGEEAAPGSGKFEKKTTPTPSSTTTTTGANKSSTTTSTKESKTTTSGNENIDPRSRIPKNISTTSKTTPTPSSKNLSSTKQTSSSSSSQSNIIKKEESSNTTTSGSNVNEIRASAVSTKMLRRKAGTPTVQPSSSSSQNTGMMPNPNLHGGNMIPSRQMASTPAPMSSTTTSNTNPLTSALNSSAGHPYSVSSNNNNASQQQQQNNSYSHPSSGNYAGSTLFNPAFNSTSGGGGSTTTTTNPYTQLRGSAVLGSKYGNTTTNPIPSGNTSNYQWITNTHQNQSNLNPVRASKQPLPSELMYAGRSTPSQGQQQPYSYHHPIGGGSRETQQQVSGTSVFPANKQGGGGSSYSSSSPLVAPFPGSQNASSSSSHQQHHRFMGGTSSSSGGGGLSVKNTNINQSIFSSNSAVGWNQAPSSSSHSHHQQQHHPSIHAHTQLAPMAGHSSTKLHQGSSSSSSGNQGGGGGLSKGPTTRVTSKLRQMVQEAQHPSSSNSSPNRKY